MKSALLALTLGLALAVPAAAKTVPIAGLHPAKKVQSMCKFYGGTFSASATGHGCKRAGYGAVWCSKQGKCVAKLEDGVKIAGN